MDKHNKHYFQTILSFFLYNEEISGGLYLLYLKYAVWFLHAKNLSGHVFSLVHSLIPIPFVNLSFADSQHFWQLSYFSLWPQFAFNVFVLKDFNLFLALSENLYLFVFETFLLRVIIFLCWLLFWGLVFKWLVLGWGFLLLPLFVLDVEVDSLLNEWLKWSKEVFCVIEKELLKEILLVFQEFFFKEILDILWNLILLLGTTICSAFTGEWKLINFSLGWGGIKAWKADASCIKFKGFVIFGFWS